MLEFCVLEQIGALRLWLQEPSTCQAGMVLDYSGSMSSGVCHLYAEVRSAVKYDPCPMTFACLSTVLPPGLLLQARCPV